MNDLMGVYDDSEFVPITWYLNSTYYIPEAIDRYNFYFHQGVPDAYFDGYDDELGGIPSGSMFSYYNPVVLNHLSDPSPLTIDAFYRFSSATSGTLFVRFDVTDPITTADNIAHFVVIESGISGTSNLARGVLADMTFALTSAGDSLLVERPFTLNGSWVKDNVSFVVFVQSHDTKEILQAAKARKAEGMELGPEENLVSAGDIGGPYSPSNKVYTIENLAYTAIDYEITHTEPWIDITNASGTIPALGTVQVTVELNSLAELLGTGLHKDVITFTNLTDGIGDGTREVSVAVGERSVAYSVDFETNPGWTSQLQWFRAAPTGGGGENGYPDPAAAHSGTYAYCYNRNGDYANNLEEKNLTSTAFDCSGLASVHLRFWRYLGVGDPSGDHAYIRVSTDNSTWLPVWQNAAAVTDSEWVQVEYDISAVADGDSTVYIRWVMGTTDASGTYCGWNVDDVELLGYTGAMSGVADGFHVGGPTIVANCPNPFNPTTSIVYELPASGRARIAVYDVAGRLVRVLSDGPVPAGRGSVTWNGTSDSGEEVASGVYFCRLETSSGVAQRTLVLLK